MKRLSKAQIEEWSRLTDAVDEAENALIAIRGEAGAFIEGVLGDAETYRDQRTERWLESDAGQEYEAWIDTMNELLNDLGREVPESLGLMQEFPPSPDGA